MKFISKEKPLSYLWIILIEIVLGILAMFGGLAIDLAIYTPPEDVEGSFPMPMFMVLFTLFFLFIVFISAIIITIRIIYLFAKKKKPQKDT